MFPERAPGRIGGFALPTAVFLVVILAALGAFILSVSQLAAVSQNLDLQGARALHAARAGIEWGAFESLRNGTCAGVTLSFPGTALEGYSTTVSCDRTAVDELGTIINADRIVALACNQPPCPAGAPAEGYVERQLTLLVAR